MKNKVLKSSTAILMSTIISSTPVFAQDNIIVSMGDKEVLSEDRIERKVTSQETLTESSTIEMTSKEFLELKNDKGEINLYKNITLTDSLEITEDCTVNLNGKTLKFTQDRNSLNNANVTFNNGTINFDGVTAIGDCILGIRNTAKLTLNSVRLDANNYSSAYALIYLYDENILNINNSTLTAVNDLSKDGGVIKSRSGKEGKINIYKSTLYFEKTERGFLHGTINIKDSNVNMSGLDNGINDADGKLDLKVDNSNITITGCRGRALTIDNSKVDIVNGSILNFSGSEEWDILFRSQGEVNVDEFSKLNFKTFNINDNIDLGLNDLIKLELYKYKLDDNGNLIRICKHEIEEGQCNICDGVTEAGSTVVDIVQDIEGIKLEITSIGEDENNILSSTVTIYVENEANEDTINNLAERLRDEFNLEKVGESISSGGYITYKIKLNPKLRSNYVNYIEIKVPQNNQDIIDKIDEILKKDNEESTGGGTTRPPSGNDSVKPIPPQEEIEFKDIKGHWAEETIKLFKDKAFINGYEDNTFRPNSNMTRAEFVKVVNKVFGYNQTATEEFKDVNQDDWFYKDICIGIKAGYIQGRSKDTFSPNDNITREEAAMILTNIMKNKDENLDKLNTFKDADKTSEWAQSSIEGAIESGYINGYEDKTIRANSDITRAEAITMMSRLKK